MDYVTIGELTLFFFFQAEDGIRDLTVTGVQTCALPISIEGQTGAAAITVTAPISSNNPGTVTDLAVAGVTDSSATLSFTEVNDGTGQAASYAVRYAASPILWGPAADVARGTCATPIAGTVIGAKRVCTV